MAIIETTLISAEVKATYTAVDNTFFHTASDDRACLIATEIGDSKVVDEFLPQFKLLRWDNEVNLSVRLAHDEVAPVISYEREKICWKGKAVEAHFYAAQEYVSEVEILLLEKPKSNIISFTLQSKGLDFFYQPALTALEITEGCERSENAVGSYAVYHASKKGDYSRAAGKNYRTGKFCHIYRPRIFDSVGAEAWGELHIDPVAGILTVEIPQEFLDKAVYPVRHAAGLTFGYDPASTPASSRSLTANYWIGSLFTSPVGGGTASALTAYVQMATGGATGNFKGTVVLHADLTIIANGVGDVSDQVTSTAGWKTSNLSGSPAIGDAVDYVLSLVCGNISAGNFKLFYDAGAANQGHYEADNNYTTPTNPAGITHSTDKVGIYVTYEAAGGGETAAQKLCRISSSMQKSFMTSKRISD